MKTTLALLIAGLIFLATPMLASAHGPQNNMQSHYRGWVKNDRDNHGSYEHRRGQKRNYRAKNRLKKELRETRRELHQVKRQIRHNRQRPYYAGRPVVVLGVPHLVFQFDW